MKKILLVSILILMAVACSRQRALDRVLADPEMKTYILSELLKDEQTRAQLSDSIFADQSVMSVYLDKLVANENARTDLLNRMLKTDAGPDWIIGKLAENPEIAAKMKSLPK